MLDADKGLSVTRDSTSLCFFFMNEHQSLVPNLFTKISNYRIDKSSIKSPKKCYTILRDCRRGPILVSEIGLILKAQTNHANKARRICPAGVDEKDGLGFLLGKSIWRRIVLRNTIRYRFVFLLSVEPWTRHPPQCISAIFLLSLMLLIMAG